MVLHSASQHESDIIQNMELKTPPSKENDVLLDPLDDLGVKGACCQVWKPQFKPWADRV